MGRNAFLFPRLQIDPETAAEHEQSCFQRISSSYPLTGTALQASCRATRGAHRQLLKRGALVLVNVKGDLWVVAARVDAAGP
jgi:hypothetical protein